MTTPLDLVITHAGRAALIDAGGGGTAAVVIAEVGLTNGVFVAAPTLTALPGEFKRIDTIAGQAADADTLHLMVRDSSADTYTARGFALYLDDGTLFAVYGQADPFLGKYSASHFLTAIDLKFAAGEAALIAFGDANFLNPPATEAEKGVAYLASIAEALAGAVADKIITPAALAAVLENYVSSTLLGAVDGVATLGPDGKLAEAQRPPADTFQVFVVADEAAMLALADAAPGNFAVQEGDGLIFVLQSLPATTLANWVEITTPAPVSSVNSKVGAVVLTAADVGAVPTTRTVQGGGLVTGGGTLAANRTLTVPKASEADVAAGEDDTKAVTPLAIAAALAGKASGGATVTGDGLVIGGGPLSTNPVLSVIAATVAELAGRAANRAVSPVTLANLPKSLTPNGYLTLPFPDEEGRMPILQWVTYRSVIFAESAPYVSWPIVFPNGILFGGATAYLAAPSPARNLWAQLAAPTIYGTNVQLQRVTEVDLRVDGFDVFMLGY